MKALTVEQFWERVARGDKDVCWPWLRGTDKDGYGKVSWRGRARRAHSVALELGSGVPLARGMCALHTCDNPICCNPGHLFAGTVGDNNRDRHAKGRDGVCTWYHGEHRPNHKLTEGDVRAIRAARSPRFLARRYGVASETIRLIRRGKAWKHVT